MCGVELRVWNLHLSHACQIRHPLSLLISTQGWRWENKRGKQIVHQVSLLAFRLLVVSFTSLRRTEKKKSSPPHPPKKIETSEENKSLSEATFSKWACCALEMTTHVHSLQQSATRASAVKHNTIRKTLHPHQLQDRSWGNPTFLITENTVAWTGFSDYHYYY